MLRTANRLKYTSGAAMAVGLATFLLGSSVSAQTYIFGRADVTVGNFPSSVATGDFNDDGKSDLAVASAGDGTLSIFLGKPDGSFERKSTVALNSNSIAVAVGDFNRDGELDLAVSNSPGTVAVFLGNGDGTFQAPVDYPTSSSPIGITVADLNGDGKLDLIVSNSCTPSISILLGNGDGTFKNHIDFDVTEGEGCGIGGAAIVADFNQDGKLDLAVPAPGADAVSVLLGNGDGTFQAFVEYGTGRQPSAVAVGDFNGDGKLDLAVTANGSSGSGTTVDTVSILVGRGDGTFAMHVDYGTGPCPTAVVAADLNGDGRLDLAIADQNCSVSPSPFGSISVLLGKGDGTFDAHVEYGTGVDPLLTVADFNGDGALDFAIPYQSCIQFSPCGSGELSILLGNGDGTFPGATNIPTLANPDSIATADFNGDGKMDLAVGNQNGQNHETLSIFLGNSDGTFQPHVDYLAGSGALAVATGDFNGDGKPDVAVANFTDNTISILLGNGDGTLQGHIDYATGGNPGILVTGDFNGDGKLDLAALCFNVSPLRVSILLGNGDGTFKPHEDFPVNSSVADLKAGDFNRDGKLDLVVVNNNAAGAASIFLGNGDGTFQAPISFPTGFFPQSVAVGDFNRDGEADLAVANSKTVAILLGNGDGTFQPHVDYDAGSAPSFIIASDVNGDGKLDLAGFVGGELAILLGNGDGTFQTYLDYAVGSQPNSIAIGDFRGDHGADVALTHFEGSSVSILLNTPAIGLFPTVLSFGNELVKTTSGPKTLLLSNPSGTPLRLDNVVIGGDDAGDFAQTSTCNTTVLAKANCTSSVTFTPKASGTRTAKLIIGDNAPTREQMVMLTGVGTVPIVTAVVGAAGFVEGIAPGGLATIFGTNLADGPESAISLPLPSTLANAEVTFNGESTPLLYVSPGQINLQIPVDLQTGAASVVVTHREPSSQPFITQVGATAPGIFLLPGGTHAAAQNANFSTNSDANPVYAGQPIILYLTGGGAVNPPVATGEAAPTTPLSRVEASVHATIGGTLATVLFAGLAPGLVGVLQVNVVVPAALTSGDYSVVIMIGNAASNMAHISVGPLMP